MIAVMLICFWHVEMWLVVAILFIIVHWLVYDISESLWNSISYQVLFITMLLGFPKGEIYVSLEGGIPGRGRQGWNPSWILLENTFSAFLNTTRKHFFIQPSWILLENTFSAFLNTTRKHFFIQPSWILLENTFSFSLLEYY